MRQVWIPRRGPPDVLEVREAPDPEPGPGEVRIRVAYAGINFADILARMGVYPDAPKLPAVVGYEVSGTVDAVGHGAGATLEGRRVVAATKFGGYSDCVCVRASHIVTLGPGFHEREAAALPVNYLTAHHMLYRLGNLTAGETVLIHGAAGGVGIAAVQLCRLASARIIGTASRPKHDVLRTLGVEPLDYRRTDWPARVLDLTDGRGVDIALDPVGGASFKHSFAVLAPGGKLFCYGVSSMVPGERRRLLPIVRSLLATPRFNAIHLMKTNRGVYGVNLGQLWKEEHLLRPQLEALVEHANAGRIAPLIDSTFPFAEAAAAHRRLQSRQNIGKVLLQPV